MRPLNSLVSLFSLQLIFLLVPSTMIEKTKAYNIARNYVPDPRISWSTCTYPELTHFLHQLVAKYSTIARLFSIGKSFEGRDLWVVLISDHPHERPLLRPQIKFVGNLIGNHGPSCYVLLRLITHLLKTFKEESSKERQLVEMNEIQILPNLNPDGFTRSIPGACSGAEGRSNAAGIDLNRDFPDIFSPIHGKIMQPETIAVIHWMKRNAFVISISMISGAVVTTYPYDSRPSDTDFGMVGPNPTPDDDTFKQLAMTYVKKVNQRLTDSSIQTLSSGNGWYCPANQRSFHNGIVNGAEWYAASGTMMDYNYVEGTFELMVGVACCRNENNLTALNRIWEANKEAMLQMVAETDYGIRGQVIDTDTHVPIAGASILKLNPNSRYDRNSFPIPWTTTSQGEFWRLILPGRYILEVRSEGYKVERVPIEIKPSNFATVIIELKSDRKKELRSPVPSRNPEKESPTGALIESVIDAFSNITHALRNVSETGSKIEPSYSKFNSVTCNLSPLSLILVSHAVYTLSFLFHD